jgi:hypothetical protein
MLARSFKRSLLAGNKSPNTVDTYMTMLTVFDRFLVEKGMPTTVAALTREHCETFLADQAARFEPNTVETRHRAISNRRSAQRCRGTRPSARLSPFDRGYPVARARSASRSSEAASAVPRRVRSRARAFSMSAAAPDIRKWSGGPRPLRRMQHGHVGAGQADSLETGESPP